MLEPIIKELFTKVTTLIFFISLSAIVRYTFLIVYRWIKKSPTTGIKTERDRWIYMIAISLFFTILFTGFSF